MAKQALDMDAIQAMIAASVAAAMGAAAPAPAKPASKPAPAKGSFAERMAAKKAAKAAQQAETKGKTAKSGKTVAGAVTGSVDGMAVTMQWESGISKKTGSPWVGAAVIDAEGKRLCYLSDTQVALISAPGFAELLKKFTK